MYSRELYNLAAQSLFLYKQAAELSPTEAAAAANAAAWDDLVALAEMTRKKNLPRYLFHPLAPGPMRELYARWKRRSAAGKAEHPWLQYVPIIPGIIGDERLQRKAMKKYDKLVEKLEKEKEKGVYDEDFSAEITGSKPKTGLPSSPFLLATPPEVALAEAMSMKKLLDAAKYLRKFHPFYYDYAPLYPGPGAEKKLRKWSGRLLDAISVPASSSDRHLPVEERKKKFMKKTKKELAKRQTGKRREKAETAQLAPFILWPVGSWAKGLESVSGGS